MHMKTEKYQTCSVPDGETGQSGLTALYCLTFGSHNILGKTKRHGMKKTEAG